MGGGTGEKEGSPAIFSMFNITSVGVAGKESTSNGPRFPKSAPRAHGWSFFRESWWGQNGLLY